MPNRRLTVSSLSAVFALLVGASFASSAEPRFRSFQLPDRLFSDAFAISDRTFVVYSRRLEYTPVDRCHTVGGTTAHLVEDLGDRFRTKRLPGTSDRVALRLSPTRILGLRPGPDGVYDTADDEVAIVDRIGDGTRTRVLPGVGALGGDPYYHRRIDDDTALFATADGGVLLTSLGGTPEVTRLGEDLGWPGFLSRTRYLRASGSDPRELFLFEVGKPDGVPLEPLAGTSDLEILSEERALSLRRDGGKNQPSFRLYTGLDGSSPTFSEHHLPFPWQDSQTTRLSADRRLLRSWGTDGFVGTADDQVLMIDHILGTPVETAIPVPYQRYDSQLVALSADAAALRTKVGPGPSGPDDVVVLLTDLGGTPTVTPLWVGPLWKFGADAPTRMGPRQLAIPVLDFDGALPHADEIAVISDIGGTNLVSHVVAGRIGVEPGLVPIAGGFLLAEAGGADGLDAPTADDELELVTVTEGTAALQAFPVPYAKQNYVTERVPELVGNGRALFGPLPTAPFSVSEDDDCHSSLYWVDGLPGGPELETQTLRLRPSAKPSAAAQLTARLVLPDPFDLVAADLTFRLGEVWQTIPSTAWQPTETGYRYEDATGANGFFRLLEYDAAAAELRVEGRGPLADGARFGRRRVVVSLESDALRIAESVETVRRDGALVARRRK